MVLLLVCGTASLKIITLNPSIACVCVCVCVYVMFFSIFDAKKSHFGHVS